MQQAISHLKSDPALERALLEVGPPPAWLRRGDFPNLVRIILEQGVSLASARAIFQRLESAYPGLSAHQLAGADNLTRLGFSRRKAEYVQGLARAAASGELVVESLAHLSDEEVTRKLCSYRGVGPWTAQIFLMLAMGRPDVFAPADLALQESYRLLSDRPERPNPREFEEIARPWRPYRSTACRLLWHYYLTQRGQISSLVE